ncbi:efflux RND transporter permease subunit [Photobacterium lutimaris]|uniref:Efflux pump membrane transporter n=1 Tax=Photobacterium lutimaris TaxID=388278 RepID=A0A2T3J0Y5_9GAMM|nr:efflux RND transporter permease subunit [Photobacterium lutimaris]PSU34745.1 hydrophobe/amphiphile efflux-1 family RND transporter [Photobacterium lutimaris]TDR77068.1 HAE1 family hydrophobic/amphiphilic exporter-1/multidrug efflux pump [Photobacterium lutimaris]
MAHFFIQRPVFAWVLAIMVMLAGIISIILLPIAQYPTIAPPAIQISATYPGASAKTAEDSVTQVIEQQMNGLDNLLYMSSTSDSFGNITTTLTFDAGTDPDIAQVQVQNKLSAATPLLPLEVQNQGVKVEKASSSILMVIGFVSDDPSLTNEDISDYISSNVLDPLSRVDGVGQTQLFGAEYAMRIWLNPYHLENYDLMPSDIVAAIQEQNAQVSAGQLGAAPAVPGQQLNATITAQSRLQTVAQFENILLKVNPDGSQVLMEDVAKVQLGSASYQTVSNYNKQPATGISIALATGKNALETAKAVRTKLDELVPFFPEGITVVYPYDTTPFIEISIEEVVKTLLEAIFLVFLVMLLFLQSFRATLIPTIAVPVVVLGTFAVLLTLGYSINTLTMFALVLAIGLLVDDAIVVVENVERIMEEEGLGAREATEKSMTQITSALVGIGMVLCAVFIPMAFFAGSTGAIYRQFSITIVTAVALSVMVAIILTPTLCIGLLKTTDGHKTTGFAGWFNRNFTKATDKYTAAVTFITHRSARFLLIYLGVSVVMALLFLRLPSSFLPDEDQGIMMSMVQLPSGSTQEQTLKILSKVEDHFLDAEKENVKSVFSVSGFSFAGSGANTGMMFIALNDWDERTAASDKVNAIVRRAMAAFTEIPQALIFAFAPPAIMELGNATGFDMFLQDRSGLGHEKMTEARNQLLGMAAQSPNLLQVRPNGLNDTPQYHIQIDQLKARALGVSINDINSTLGTALGSNYVNDFVDRGRIKQVYVQADMPYRMNPEDIMEWKVRNQSGEMVAMRVFSKGEWTYGSPRLERYNGTSAMEILGEPAAGVSTGEAMLEMEQIVSQLPQGVGLEWTGMSYQERISSGQAPLLYALSILIVFLCLAALYESWAVPFSVILIIPLGVLGAVSATLLFGLDNDVYFQVGLLTTIGLGSKNAIMIVEFAKAYHDSGEDMFKAAIHAAKIRLRPILMTSLAFGMGVAPLAISSGAGSGAQNAVGTGVVGGVITATFLGIFFVPLFFVVVTRVFHGPDTSPTPAEETPHD